MEVIVTDERDERFVEFWIRLSGINSFERRRQNEKDQKFSEFITVITI